MMRIFLFLYLTFSVTLSNSWLMSQVQTSIIAKVENRIISSYDLKNKVKLILFLSNQELTQSNINSVKQPALRTLIDLKLKEEELSNLNLPIKKDQNVKLLMKLDQTNIIQMKIKLKKGFQYIKLPMYYEESVIKDLNKSKDKYDLKKSDNGKTYFIKGSYSLSIGDYSESFQIK